uniref:Uncharacterized protein n=1 Tax=Arundo donax TaxID=35708 RepID=A0A0A9C6T4_ARUDO
MLSFWKTSRDLKLPHGLYILILMESNFIPPINCHFSTSIGVAIPQIATWVMHEIPYRQVAFASMQMIHFSCTPTCHCQF